MHTAEHVVHADVDKLGGRLLREPKRFQDRIMVAKKAERIDIECVVRGYITGGGWRSMRKPGKLTASSFRRACGRTRAAGADLHPAAKNDVGHDEDIPFDGWRRLVGAELTDSYGRSLGCMRMREHYCEANGHYFGGYKFEFGLIDGEMILIDEIFTPDSSRYWAKEKYALDMEIDSMDKEPVRNFLANPIGTFSCARPAA